MTFKNKNKRNIINNNQVGILDFRQIQKGKEWNKELVNVFVEENDIFEGNKGIRNSTKTQMTTTKMRNIVYESESYLINIIWAWLKLKNTLLNSHSRILPCNDQSIIREMLNLSDSTEYWEGILKLCMLHLAHWYIDVIWVLEVLLCNKTIFCQDSWCQG